MNDTTTTYSCARDYQLFGPGPKRVLALDGGGVRGAITVAFLEHIEAILCAHLGKETRLGDHFHLVGGTSTGAIIAGAIALGFRATQVKEFYTRLAPLAFKRQRWALPILQAKFDVRGLRGEIENIVGDLELQSDKLVTGIHALPATRLPCADVAHERHRSDGAGAMQWLGECTTPWVINSEIGTLAGDGPPGGKLFRFTRYDVRLEREWLDDLGVTVADADIARYRCMDDPNIVPHIYEIASRAAEKQVKPEHFFGPARTRAPVGAVSTV